MYRYLIKSLSVHMALAFLGFSFFTSCGKDDDDNFLFLLPLLNTSAAVTPAVTSETPGGTTGPTNQGNAGGFDIVVPTEDIDLGPTPDGDFNGITFKGSDTPTSGFISVIVNGGKTSAADIANALIAILNGSDAISNATVVSAQQASGASDTQLLNLQLSTASGMTITDVSNLILTLFGTSVTNGTVTGLPTNTGETNDTEFRIVVQIIYDSTDGVLLGIGVSTEDEYSTTEPVLTGLLDGTNFGPSSSEKSTYTNSFISVGPPKSDFIFVVDNSGSMAQEQTAVATVASSFFDRIGQSNTDFNIGVITTDSDAIRSPGFTNNRNDFITSINAGINGSGTESGLYFGEKTLLENGGAKKAGYPRIDSGLSVIIISDEGDHYSSYSGGSKLDVNNNVFKNNGIRLHALIGLDSSGMPGKCTGTNGTRATSSNTTNMDYYNVSQASGGATSSICSNNFGAFLNIVATQGVGSASAYQLTKTPISSSLAVSVNGVSIPKSTSNGYLYDSVSNTLIFYGASIPAVNDTILVSFSTYDSNQVAMGSGLLASMWDGGPTTSLTIILGFLAILSIFIIRMLRGSRKESRNYD